MKLWVTICLTHCLYGLGAIQLVRKSSSWTILLEEEWVGATVSFSVDATGLGRMS
jgi:hypothetical protein